MKYVKWWTSESEWLNWLNIHCTPILSWELMHDAQMQLDNALLVHMWKYLSFFFFPLRVSGWKFNNLELCYIFLKAGVWNGSEIFWVSKKRAKRLKIFTYLFIKWAFWYKAWIFSPPACRSQLQTFLLDMLVFS